MKKAKKLMIAMLIATLAFTLSAFVVTSAAADTATAPIFIDSIVPGGNFEQDVTFGTVNNNGVYYTEAGRTAALSEEKAHTGSKSMKVGVGTCDNAWNGTFGYRLDTVPVYELTHTNNGKTFVITAYVHATAETQWLGMFVHMIGWTPEGYPDMGEYTCTANNWTSVNNGWVKLQTAFTLTKSESGIAVQQDGGEAVVKAAQDVAAFKIYFRSNAADNAPLAYYVDDLSVKFATGVTFSDENAIEKGGDFEVDATYGNDIVAGGWRQSNTVLSNSADVALSGEKSLKVSGGTDAIYRFTDLNSYNMTVYNESTYTVSASVFSKSNYAENTAIWKGMILNVVTYTGTSYADHFYDFTQNNWTPDSTWTDFSITFKVIKTATGIEVSVNGGEATAIPCDGVAAIDVFTRSYNAVNGACDYYVDCFTATRAPVLFANPADGIAGEVVSVEIADGEKVVDKLASISTPTKEGYVFDKWVDADGNAITDALVMAGSDISIFATYKIAQFTVSFDANAIDATGAVAAQTVEFGTEITLGDGFAREGYDFVGWATSATENAIYMAGDKYTVNGDATLYAVWEEKEEVVTPGTSDSTVGSDTTVPGSDSSTASSSDSSTASSSEGACFGGIGATVSTVFALIIIAAAIFTVKFKKVND